MQRDSRKIAAILAADVVEYSRLMGADEAGTLAALKSRRAIFQELVREFDGREFGSVGDSLMAEFASAVNAVSCALEIQRRVTAANAALPQAARMQLRIGVNLGDVIEEKGSAFGDAVNVAARLQALTKPGGVLISGPVYDQVHLKVPAHYTNTGAHRVKNIAEPVRTFEVLPSQGPGIAGRIAKFLPRFASWRLRRAALVVVTLAAAIALGQYWREVGTPGAQRSRTGDESSRALAVLPFADVSAAGENAEFLALGLHDELLTLLSRIHGLKVISRTSTARYRGRDKSLGQIGRELGVSRILEGSVQRAGNRIRVNVQLIDASSDQHIWAERYDREISPDSLFQIQGDVAVAIARSMQSALSTQERKDLARVPTDSLEAYQAYLIGKHRMIARTTQGIGEAADYFREAIRLDPDFAPAYVGLADAFFLRSEYGGLSRTEMTAQATPLLDRALALDDRLAPAYTTMGVVRARNADFSGAEAAFRRAIEIDPNNSTAFHWYGDVLLIKSQPEKALPLLRRALELDPLSPAVLATLGQILEALGQFKDALKQYRKIIEIEPDSPLGYLMVGHYERFVNGRFDEAVRSYHQSVVRDPGNATVQASLGLAYLNLGDSVEAAAWIHRAVDQGRDQYWPVAAAMRLALWEHRDADVRHLADQLRDMSPQANDPLLGRVHLGDYREIVSLHADRFPELFCSGEQRVSRENLFQAINLSLARQQTGEDDCATRMLSGALEVMSRMPRLGSFGFGIADVEVLSRLGRTESALITLRQAIDSGWRANWNWWLQGERNPHLIALRRNPEFGSMMNEVRHEMATQLAHVQEMADKGELASEP